MKLIFFGSSHGVPEANRKCSSTLVEIGDRYYFIDMGTAVIEGMVTRGISIEKVKGVFITHMHGDHTNGLIDFANLLSWYFLKAEPVIYLPRIESAKIIEDWISLNDQKKRELHYEEVKPGVIYDDGVLQVTAITTQHISKSYAFLLEAEGSRVLFTGDLKKPSEDFPDIAKDCEIDLLVCEGAHFPVSEYKSVLAKCRVNKICVNHYVPWNIADIQQFKVDMRTVPVTIANDGLEIQI